MATIRPTLLITAFLVCCGSLNAQTLRAITMDGDFSDWEGIAPVATGTSEGAPPGEVSFGRLWIANDQNALYLKVETGRETIWQEPLSEDAGNDIRLYIDGNANTTFGANIEGMDTDVELRLGERILRRHWSDTNSSDYSLGRVPVLGFPTHSSETFEFRLPRSFRPFNGEVTLIHGDTIRLFLRDGTTGDRLPAEGFIEYAWAPGSISPPEPIPFERMHPRDVRVLVHNAEDTAPANPERQDPYRRYLAAMNPDIICFQEIYDEEDGRRPDVEHRWSAQETRDFVASVLDPSPGDQWYVAKSGDNVTVSKWPIIATAGTNRFLVTYVDMPADVSHHNLVIFNVHTPCCQANDWRDEVHDRISAMWRDLLNGVGPFPIEPDSAVIMAGDFNMVGFVRQFETVRDGQIIDSVRFGPSFSPARADGPLTVAPLRHSHVRTNYTWRRFGSAFSPGRLDFIMFSGDVMTLKRNFVLDTATTPFAVLSEYDLRADTTEVASDHLPLVADFEFDRDDPIPTGWMILGSTLSSF